MTHRLILLCLSAVSVSLGTVYSVHNTDPHHWGVILSAALDFIRGKSLFTEIYIQYGAGQPILFKFLSYLVPINYTTIGIIASAVYAMNFPIIFASVKHIGNSTQAIVITAIAFLIHPFAIYPWPDYFAGLCISLSCYFLVAGNPDGTIVRRAIPGALLFLAFMFRNTYLLNIGSASLAYVVLSSFSQRPRQQDVYWAIGVFAALLGAYLGFLSWQGNLGHWYSQDFGAATDQAGVGYGIGIGSVAKMISKLIFVEDLLSAIFLGLLLVSCYMILLMLVRSDKDRHPTGGAAPGVVIFLSLLGCAGAAQAIFHQDIFRLQNAGMALYLGLAFFSKEVIPDRAHALVRRLVRLTFGVLIVALAAKFPYVLTGTPHTSATWPIIALPVQSSFRSFAASDIPIFKFHRFQSAEQEYYEGLRRYICDGQREILNFTGDTTIPYLCPGQGSAVSLPIVGVQELRRINEREADRVHAGAFKANEVIVAVTPPSLDAGIILKLVGTVERPKSIRWMDGGSVSIFHVEPVASRP